MAQQAQKVVSQFPLPPKQYYRSFASKPVPTPPRPPGESDSYHMFGREYTTEDRLPSLEEAGRKRLYDPAKTPCSELRRLNKELLSVFRKLVNDLCEPLPPDAPENPHKELVERIEDIFVNMQHLINVMRPAQAAMDLKILLDRQTKSRKEMADKLGDSVKKAWELIGEAANKLAEPSVELSESAQAPLPVDEPEKDPMEDVRKGGEKEKNALALGERRPMAEVLEEISQIVANPSL